jgi:PTS system N-acetylglucosamine-specific IIC component
LAILFALGVAVGLAKDNNGTPALAALVGYLILDTILKDINKDINTGVLGGILVGIIAASLYNKYKDIRLPSYLAFFGGKRFVPIITGLVCVLLGVLLGYIWPPIQNGINFFGNWLIAGSGAWGVFVYGVLNRILIITGLHHVLNNLVWFVFGNYTNSSAVVVHGDIARFMAGDKSAGFFMAGYFPIMMFGLPAACLAMYKNARTETKKAVFGMLLSMALTSFLTGVTEPIEFAFVFLAPILFVIHALLTGLSMAAMYLLNVHLGFTFSAGLIDYVLFFKLATNPLYLLPVGGIFFIIYYVTFDFFIRKYDLPTIGRDIPNIQASVAVANTPRALQFIEALGGATNIVSVDSCTTRLRLALQDSSNINKSLLKVLGSHGEIAPNRETLQVVVGTTADLIASEIKEALRSEPTQEVKQQVKPQLNPQQDCNINQLVGNLAKQIVDYVGGKNNIKNISVVSITRLRVEVLEPGRIAPTIPESLPLIDLSDTVKQFYLADNAQGVYLLIKEL